MVFGWLEMFKSSGILLKIYQEREQVMSTRKREKVKSTPFSVMPQRQKNKYFFEKIRGLAIED